jgi:hypothetical protein
VQPIRTFAEIPIEFETPLQEPFTYQQLKAEAIRLYGQGLSYGEDRQNSGSN